MEDESADIIPFIGTEEAVFAADQFVRATKLASYQEGLREETLRRQRNDLLLFERFLKSVRVQPGDFFHDLEAWSGVTAGLLETFIVWQKMEGYAIGSINVRPATVKAYCHLAFDAGFLEKEVHIHIQGAKSIPRRQARNIDARREMKRIGHKKAEPVEIPDELLPRLKHPETGPLAKRDALLMSLFLDHGLRVGEVAILKRNPIALRSRLLTFYRPKVDEPQIDRLTDDTLVAARANLPIERLKQAGGWSNIQTPLRYIKESAIANEGVILE